MKNGQIWKKSSSLLNSIIAGMGSSRILHSNTVGNNNNISSSFAVDEFLISMHNLWPKESQIKRILLQYNFNKFNYLENDQQLLINLLTLFPPSTFEIQESPNPSKRFHVSFIKALYSICYANPYFKKGVVKFENKSFISYGLLYKIREAAFPHNRIIYQICNMLCSAPKEFKFDEFVMHFDR